jgi:protein-S-isoprenylcysteine O-methyltransferase Ste14
MHGVNQHQILLINPAVISWGIIQQQDRSCNGESDYGVFMMTDELAPRLGFSVVWIIIFVGIAWVVNATRASAGKQLRTEVGWLRVAAVVLAVPYFIGAIAYLIFPSWIPNRIPLPDLIRWFMLCLSTMGVVFMLWGLRVLGKNWAPSTTGVRGGTVLVTSGPYAIVRNPIYVGALILLPCMALVAASWLMLLPGVALTIILYIQVGIEEASLMAHFGDAYREYMKRTPRLLPKLRHGSVRSKEK